MRTLIAVTFSLGLVASSWAQAAPQTTVKYRYYPVSGYSAADVYAAMLRNGPRVDGAMAFAATSAADSVAHDFRHGQSCQTADYRLKIDFVTTLPQLSSSANLPALDRNRLQDFLRFVAGHEATHRSIWMGCAANLEAQVQTIDASSCTDAGRQVARLWEAMRASCSRKHEAFDAAQAKLVIRQPFVRLALLSHRLVAQATGQ